MAAGSDEERAQQGADLNEAITKGDRAKVLSLLGEGVSVHQPDFFRQVPMFVAARDGRADMIGLLVERGVDVNAAVQGGRGPLFHAASRGHAEAVRLLIARGAAVNAIDAYGQTPLLTAALSLANEALNVREPARWRESQQRTPQGNAAVVEVLVLAGADVDYSHKGAHTARHFIREVAIPRLIALMPKASAKPSFLSGLFGKR
jgi:ankyrin repeat protein